MPVEHLWSYAGLRHPTIRPTTVKHVRADLFAPSFFPESHIETFAGRKPAHNLTMQGSKLRENLTQSMLTLPPES